LFLAAIKKTDRAAADSISNDLILNM